MYLTFFVELIISARKALENCIRKQDLNADLMPAGVLLLPDSLRWENRKHWSGCSHTQTHICKSTNILFYSHRTLHQAKHEVTLVIAIIILHHICYSDLLSGVQIHTPTVTNLNFHTPRLNLLGMKFCGFCQTLDVTYKSLMGCTECFIFLKMILVLLVSWSSSLLHAALSWLLWSSLSFSLWRMFDM